jgi:hypothetical protein
MDINFLSDEYIAANADEADRICDYRNSKNLDPVILRDRSTHQPLAWVVPQVMSPEECQHILQTVQNLSAYGKDMPHKLKINHWDGQRNLVDLSKVLLPRLQHDFEEKHDCKNNKIIKKKAKEGTMVDSISPSWRVVKLEPGEEFPAHQDAMDSVHKKHKYSVSTHSVLLDLTTASSSTVQGGATRLYCRQKPTDGPYDYAIDVYIPNDWALIVKQHKDLWYAGQASVAVTKDDKKQSSKSKPACRYILQTGLMKTLPDGATVESLRGRSSTAFVLGPGLLEFLEEEAELANYGCDSGAPRGWGRHSNNPKTTLWKDGRPLVKIDPAAVQRVPAPGLCKERRWSIVNQETLNEETRRQSQRRRSSVQVVDPIRKRCSLVDKKDLLDHTETSHTDLDMSESYRAEDDVVSAAGKTPSYKVTRKPREDSMVGRLMKVFQSQ